MDKRRYGSLDVIIEETADAVGTAVADAFADATRQALGERDEIAVVLATGNSQLSFARAVAQRSDIDWSRITVLHMDEYLGMPEDHPASFRRWMRQNIVERVHPKAFEGIRGDHQPVDEELDRYRRLVSERPPAITVMGIGENGHLAFNDPPADFTSTDVIRVVRMDERSRLQQVGEGHFRSLDETPTYALSLTIPALLAADTVLVGAPELRKAAAVTAALQGEFTPDVPASILRAQEHARLFLDRESASALDSP